MGCSESKAKDSHDPVEISLSTKQSQPFKQKRNKLKSRNDSRIVPEIKFDQNPATIKASSLATNVLYLLNSLLADTRQYLSIQKAAVECAKETLKQPVNEQGSLNCRQSVQSSTPEQNEENNNQQKIIQCQPTKIIAAETPTELMTETTPQHKQELSSQCSLNQLPTNIVTNPVDSMQHEISPSENTLKESPANDPQILQISLPSQQIYEPSLSPPQTLRASQTNIKLTSQEPPQNSEIKTDNSLSSSLEFKDCQSIIKQQNQQDIITVISSRLSTIQPPPFSEAFVSLKFPSLVKGFLNTSSSASQFAASEAEVIEDEETDEIDQEDQTLNSEHLNSLIEVNLPDESIAELPEEFREPVSDFMSQLMQNAWKESLQIVGINNDDHQPPPKKKKKRLRKKQNKILIVEEENSAAEESDKGS